MMDSNDELTIAARVKGWEIFSPDWDYLRQFPALELASLCALSVGLHPAFASPGWVFNIAMPHFSGTDPDECCPLEDAAEGAKWAALLDDFLRRVQIAVGNLVPCGTLPIADGAADGERTVVKVADFVAWATSLPDPWELPEEMKRMGPYPEAEEGLQDGSGGAKPLGKRERDTLLTIIAAFCKFESYDLKERGLAAKIAQMTQDLGAPVSGDTIRAVLAQIPGAVESRMK